MLQKISSVFVVYRRKTLTGSPDPTHANGMDKPCSSACSTGWIKLMAVTSNVGQVIILLINYLQNYALWVL